jgi:di/tricarboxylate transporter
MSTEKIPQPAWALLVAVLGVYCATVGYCLPGDTVSKQAMFTIANTLISGALGAFVSHAAGTIQGANSNIIQPPPPEV